jgi:hypothetical protein
MPISNQDAQQISATIHKMYPPGNPGSIVQRSGTHDGEEDYYLVPSINAKELTLLDELVPKLTSCYFKLSAEKGLVVIGFTTSNPFEVSVSES